MSATTVALINTTQVIVGTGAPEGAVVGSVGDIYLRTDGAAGTTLYIKQSGAATNTGWGVIAAGSSGVPFAFSGQYYSPMVEDGNSGATKTIDWNAGNEHTLTLTAACTLTLSNPVDGGRYVLLLIQDGTGSRVPTFPASVLWAGGTVPTWSTLAGKVDLVTMMWRATSSKYFAAANVGY